MAGMSDDAKGGLALIAGSAAGLVTMALHPRPHDIFGGPDVRHAVQVGAFVHGLAIAATVVSFLGTLALYRRTADAARFSLAALVTYGFASVAVILAAAMSGFVATGLALMAEPPPHAVLAVVGLLNQAFAKIYTVAACAAIFLWSCAIWRGRTLARALALYGLVTSPVIAILVLVGHLRLDVHGFGLVVLAQSIWFVWTALLLLRPRPA